MKRQPNQDNIAVAPPNKQAKADIVYIGKVIVGILGTITRPLAQFRNG